MSGMLLRAAEIMGRPGVDVRVRAGRVVELGADLRRSGEQVLHCGGGALLPGLVDHHLHLYALAAQRRSASCGPPGVTDEQGLAAALSAAALGDDGWVRGTGYTETVAGDLGAALLDRLHPGRPVRVQHRSGALWAVNTRGAELLGLAAADHPGVERDPDGRPTGRLWRADGWLRDRLGRGRLPNLAGVAADLSRLGITAVTDATPDLSPAVVAALATARRSGTLPQRVHLLGVPLDSAHLDTTAVAVGPYKLVLADSALPGLDDLVERVRAAHAAGRAVAVHVVTREALALLLAALQITGVRDGDRIEHGALLPAGILGDLAHHRVRVVTQPGFLADRGDDYLRDVPPGDLSDLYRTRSLRTAGVPLALSSDAPYGPLDPWRVIRAAVDRRARSGAVLGPVERVTAETALAGYLADATDPGGPPRAVVPGVAADLVLLDRPLAAALQDPSAEHVRSVLIEGRVTFHR